MDAGFKIYDGRYPIYDSGSVRQMPQPRIIHGKSSMMAAIRPAPGPV
jgi:hypothetical protein